VPAHSPQSACSEQAWAFGRLDELWERLSPLTPYGKDRKAERRVLSDRARIERAYDDAEAFAVFAAAGGADARADRLTHHLRRLPRLPFGTEEGAGGLDLVGLFQVKKFLANYRAAANLLDDGLRQRFDLRFEAHALAAALDEGGSDPETFYIADAMHPDLPSLRAAVAETAAALSSTRETDRQSARLELGLDFRAREFLVVPAERARPLLASPSPLVAVTVEPYDASSCVVRLQDGSAALELAERLDGLLARERELEAQVVARLARLVRHDAARLLRYTEAVCALDLARARAALALELQLTRPELGSDRLVARGARFLPCEWDCRRLGLVYAPLDLTLDEGAAVLFGSNMGGKTVALQSLVFLQAAAQAGLFVPAESYATSVYPWIGYVGELAADRAAAARSGLSGFGFEIRSFLQSWRRADAGGAFLVLDEFARTTSSLEAEAMLSAVVEALAGAPRSRSVLATHFRGVARLPGVRYLRLLGLDRERAARAMAAADEPLPERIRRINGMMRYQIVDEPPEDDGGSDAVTIARLLGLDARIVDRAEELLARRGGPAREPERGPAAGRQPRRDG